MLDLANAELGSEGDLSLKLEDGKVKLSIKHQSSAVGVGVEASLDPDYFIDKLAEMIPGEIDDAIFTIIKGAVKGL